MSWLRKLLVQQQIPLDPHFATTKGILQSSLDPVDKCEALLEALERTVPPERAETFVRQALEKYNCEVEARGPGAGLDLDDPPPSSVQVHPVVAAQTRKKSLNVNAQAFNLAAPEFTPASYVAEDPDERGDDLYLEYEEEEGYNTFAPESVLQSVFLDMSMEEISNLLDANGWNVEKTLEAILKPPPATLEAVAAPYVPYTPADGRTVCRHFLAGECLRSDCWFSHDPEALVCKFWLSGGCVKGDSCPFTHGGGLLASRASTTYSPPATPPAPRGYQPPAVDDFPALGPAKPPSAPKLDFWGPTKAFVDVAKQKPPTAVAQTSAYTAPKVPHRRSTRLVETKWVATGDTLAATYARHRGDAISAAIQRNKLFQRATEAYLAGNKAAAKAFSLGAHRLNERVQELHRQAGQRIFETRNSSTASHPSEGTRTVDLHGLHPDESVEMLQSQLAKLKRENFSGRVVIVTGTGHHSRGQKAKVLPAIREFLHKAGLRAEEATMSDSRGGMFVLQT
ncbi:hypothetical protein HKX48_003579 [Thoreauomyces humboldtii]|nr:hypothetical protein HKX48_003579 [Thoreauomyces humboldtii]